MDFLRDLFVALVLPLFVYCDINSNNEEERTLSLTLVGDKYVQIGENATLTCEVETDEEPTVVWERDYQLLTKDETSSLVYPLQVKDLPDSNNLIYVSVLVVEVLTNHTYSCQATNKYGTSSLELPIAAGRRPTVRVEILPENGQPAGHNVSLVSSIVSESPPTVNWFYQRKIFGESESSIVRIKIGEVVPTGMNEYISHLNLYPVRQNATYLCIVENPYGESQMKAVVTVARVFLGDECLVNLDCSTLNSRCIEDTCKCPHSKPIHIKYLEECLPVAKFQKRCLHHAQCKAYDKNSRCTGRRMTCQCDKDHVYSMSKKHCLKTIMEKGFTKILTILGCGLAAIVIVTLSLYFLRKKMDNENAKKSSAKGKIGKKKTVVKCQEKSIPEVSALSDIAPSEQIKNLP